MEHVSRRQFCRIVAGGAAGYACGTAEASAKPPNILFILADDLGYGDVHFLNPERGKLPTPNIDRLATQGMTFTDAHSGSAVCSPTRYGVLTGRYAWRSRLQKGVLLPYDPPLIPPSRPTVASLLRGRGYATACIGKWHLGWNWPRENGRMAFEQPITGGPTEVGFDSYFGTDVPNYPPYCFIENDRTLGIPSVPKPKEMFGNPGLMLPGWKLEAVLPELARKSVDCIKRSAQGNKPFFLYLPVTSPHRPLAVAASWRRKSVLGLYGDWVMQTDSVVGEVLGALERSGQAENTLVIFTSDNGCAPSVGIDYDIDHPKQGRVQELEAKGHYPSGPYRGYKSDIWDGGHRVAFVARWPGVIKPDTRSDQTICLTDFMATCAEITGARIPPNAGEDSVSILRAFQGQARKPLREATVHHSINGKFAIRQGRWKLVLCAGSGGWTQPTDAAAAARHLPEIQLYDMHADSAERVNLQDRYPAEARRLTALLESYVRRGRSTRGPDQANDVTIDLWKKSAGSVMRSD